MRFGTTPSLACQKNKQHQQQKLSWSCSTNKHLPSSHASHWGCSLRCRAIEQILQQMASFWLTILFGTIICFLLSQQLDRPTLIEKSSTNKVSVGHSCGIIETDGTLSSLLNRHWSALLDVLPSPRQTAFRTSRWHNFAQFRFFGWNSFMRIHELSPI